MPASVAGGWTAGQVRAVRDEAHHRPLHELVDGLALVTSAARPVAGLVERWTPADLRPEPLAIDLAALFAEACGDAADSAS